MSALTGPLGAVWDALVTLAGAVVGWAATTTPGALVVGLVVAAAVFAVVGRALQSGRSALLAAGVAVGVWVVLRAT